MDRNQNVRLSDGSNPGVDRRRFLTRLASGVFVALTSTAAFADELVRTPSQTEGPFYPDILPLDRDNDLIIVNNGITPAVGEVTNLTGRVLDLKGNPIKGARVEIWQVDSHGAYIHTRDFHGTNHDKNFQGFGQFETGASGEYRFRTIKPVAYPGRTPHIHIKVWKGDQELLTTQCYVKGEPQNQRDGVLRSIQDTKQRNSVIVPFVPVKSSKIGELSARLDLVIGFTPTA